MQIWCDCRVSSTSGNLHPVFDNIISSNGDGYQCVIDKLILDGEVIMSGKKFKSGDIILIQPNESTDFKALTDVKTIVVKTPSIDKDKFLN